MVNEKNLKKEYRATLFTRIQKLINKSGKTTNMILTELKKEYPDDYQTLNWETVQNRLVQLQKDNLIRMNIVRSVKKPIYVWSEEE